MDTEILDKLYLEISQYTRAKTRRQIELENAINSALLHLRDASPRNGPIIVAIGILENASEKSK